MSATRVLALAALVVPLCAEQNQMRAADDGGLGSGLVVSSAPTLQHTLRICNAYTSATPLDVFDMAQGSGDLTALTKAPISYKACKSLMLPMKEGDEYKFKIGKDSVGEFTTSGVPQQPATMLLVIRRRPGGLKSAAFESHVFADSALAQIALIDAFHGTTNNTQVELAQNLQADGKPGKPLREGLTFGSIAFVKPGDYTFKLGKSARNITVGKHASILAMRVGQGSKYPEELVLYEGGAAAAHISLALLVLSALLATVRGL